MSFVNEKGGSVDIDFEKDEQTLVKKYIPADGKVLELGARYGTVSCVLSQILNLPHVAVEPDTNVIQALEKNRENNGGKFHIFNGVVSKKNFSIKFIDKSLDPSGYGTHTVLSDTPSLNTLSLEELQKKYDIEFDCLVADCEGFLFQFFEENPWFLNQLRVIIYEQDGTPWDKMDYSIIDNLLTTNGFTRIHTIPHPTYANNPHFHNVWVKTSGK